MAADQGAAPRTLEGRVAIVTGAGRGLGRAHALHLAGRGAAVVVNDLGVSLDGRGREATVAQEVADEIEAAGGRALASGHDVGDWQEAAELIEAAVEAFGELHVLVNNAGILRDRSLARMEEAELDAVLRVNLKGHIAPTCHAFAYWRRLVKETGAPVSASVIHTASPVILGANLGQAAYGAAKLGVVGLSATADLEGERYGIRSNAVAPSARTRMTTAGTQDGGDLVARPGDAEAFDPWDPANVSALVGWLARAECPASGQIFQLLGRKLRVISMPAPVHELEHEAARAWTEEALDGALDGRLLERRDLMRYVEP